MLEWVISSAVLTALVIALRFILKGKISLRLQYALWALVLLRLLVPLSFGSTELSIANITQKAAETETAKTLSTLTQLELPRMTYSGAYSEVAKEYAEKGIDIAAMSIEEFETVDYEILSRMEGQWSIRDILKAVWIFGIAVFGLLLLVSNIRFTIKLRRSRYRLEGQSYTLPVYVSPDIDTPCLFGLLRPAIYITPEAAADDTVLHHTAEHELSHFRHGDHIWSLLRGVCLSIHWYSPLVWLAAALSRNDSELACDEATIKRIGENERAEYGRTLIGMTCQKRPALLLSATTMTGSKSAIKERIMLIAKKPKTAIYTLVAVLLIAAVAVGCMFTGANGENSSAAEQTLYNCDGLTLAIPNEYADRLYFPESLRENELIQVYEKQSYEESRADWDGDAYAGFLFSIVRYPPAQHEQYLSSDGSGLTFFAKDDSYYYGHGYATDVQFYRSDIDIYNEDSFAPWTELTDAIDGILNDFVIRNDLTAYSDDEFWNREFTYNSAHVYVAYYPYYSINGSKDALYTLVLSQPATQGDGGIWCVERWYEDNENLYYYFPSWNDQTDFPAADYYAQLQAECDNGHRPDLLDPIQAAAEFVMSYFDHTPTLASFEFIEGKPESN
jgi:beta-lactamase regulating signal transducer with metallopeptidase domain